MIGTCASCMRSGKLNPPPPGPTGCCTVLPQPVTVASVPGRSRASTPGVTSMIGLMPKTGEARWTTATSWPKAVGFQRGWMLTAAARRFWPWVLDSTVRPTTTRRSLSGTWSGPGPKNSTQWAAVRTW